MPFTKGHKINLGKKYSIEHRKKIGITKIGKKQNWPHLGMLGKKHSSETKKKISIAQIGKKKKPMSEIGRKNISIALKGRRTWNKGKVGFWGIKGEKNHNWKGGVTHLYKKIRKSTQYKLWREAVFKRDDWTCQECKQKGGILQPHHIKPFSLYPLLRFDIKNGQTLCEECHRKTETWGFRTKLYQP